MPAKPARITLLLSVGITPQIKTELEMACEYFGVTPSQFARQSIVEALMRCGVRPAPGLLYQQAQAAQAAKNVNGE
jgi:hypothetical protein